MVGSCFDGSDYLQFPQEYDGITLEELQRFIKLRVIQEQAVLSVIYPKHKEE